MQCIALWTEYDPKMADCLTFGTTFVHNAVNESSTVLWKWKKKCTINNSKKSIPLKFLRLKIELLSIKWPKFEKRKCCYQFDYNFFQCSEHCEYIVPCKIDKCEVIMSVLCRLLEGSRFSLHIKAEWPIRWLPLRLLYGPYFICLGIHEV